MRTSVGGIMDMYSNKFVVAVLTNSGFAKELANSVCLIPFNSEYKIRLRNKHNKRAVCKLFIDNEHQGDFVIPANNFIDIEHPVDNNNKFKFVSLDSDDAIDYGKNGPNSDGSKGVIRAEFALEKSNDFNDYKPYPPYVPYIPPYVPYRPSIKPYEWPYACPYKGGQPYQGWDSIIYGNSSNTHTSNHINDSAKSYMNQVSLANFNNLSLENAEDGVTVAGTESSQQFSTTHCNVDNNWTIIKLVLRGVNTTQEPPQEARQEAPVSILPKSPTCVGMFDKAQSEALQDTINALKLEKLKLEKQKLEKEIRDLKKSM